MGDVERVMERVHRLLAIANDPAASDNEQRIALEQAQRLMDRHAIEEWQLEEDHDDVEIIERRIRLETNPCNRYMAQLANIVAHGNRCRAAYECRRAGNGRDVVSTVWTTAPALTSTRPNPSGPPWKPAAPPCGAKGPGPHPVRKPMRHGGTATIVVSRKRSPADTRSFDVRWNRTAPAGSSSPCAAARSIDGSKPTSHSSPTSRNSPKPQDPAKPPTGTEDGTGRARRSVSRKPDRPATGPWKSSKQPKNITIL